MDAPRVFGDIDAFRRKLIRRGKRADDILERIESASTVIAGARDGDVLRQMDAMVARDDVAQTVRRWHQDNRRLLDTHLGEGSQAWMTKLPVTAKRPEESLDLFAAQVRDQAQLFQRLLDLLPRHRALHSSQRGAVAFDELRLSGLLDEEMLDALERRMIHLGHRRRLPGAIAAAKELTEAVMRVALETIAGVPPSKRLELPALHKQLMEQLRARAKASPTQATFESLDRFLSHLRGIVTFLAEWRNELGEGHGRRSIPSGLSLRHAALAVDAATAYARFMVLTLDDLGVLPATGDRK